MEKGHIGILIISTEKNATRELVSALNNFSEVRINAILSSATDMPEIILSTRPDLIITETTPSWSNGPEWAHHAQKELGKEAAIIYYGDDFPEQKYPPHLPIIRRSALREDLEKVIDRFKTKPDLRGILTSAYNHYPKIILIQTPEGYRFVDSNRIVLFIYSSHSRNWMLILSDNRKLKLQHRTNAKSILRLTPAFIQVNQNTIINFHYLVRIENYKKQCIFRPPFHTLYKDIYISRSYYDKLRNFII